MTQSERTLHRKNLRRVRKDRMRSMRVISAVESSAVLHDSPVELEEGYSVSDRDTGELFLMLRFRSLSKMPLESLRIRALLYQEQMVNPSAAIPFCYSWTDATLGERTYNGKPRTERECRKEHVLEYGESFGGGVYLPLPSGYFKKLQIELVDVTDSNGRQQTLHLIAGGRAARFIELQEEEREAYTHLNIFREGEQSHPIRVLPQAGERAWLCCCGHKNPSELARCEQCARDKDWQLANLSQENLRSAAEALPQWHRNDVTDFEKKRAALLEDEAELSRKLEEAERAMKNITLLEQERDRKQSMLVPKIALIVAGLMIFVWFLNQVAYIVERYFIKP